MILEGTTSSGAVVPVQVTDQGKVVAEGLQGPEGPEGPQGPQGPPGPAGDYWQRTGTVVSPTNAGDTIATDDNAVQLAPGNADTPLVRDSGGRLVVGSPNASQSIKNNSSYFPQLQCDSNDSTAGAAFRKFRDTGGAAFVNIQRARGTKESPDLVGENDSIGEILFSGYEGTRWISAANIKSVVDGATGAGNIPGRLVFETTGPNETVLEERARLSSTGVFTLGNRGGAGLNPVAVMLDPGSTDVPLVRDSVGRLLVGMDSAPGGTVAGDVVCQGAVVLQSPNGMWWAIEVQDDGTLYASQTAIR